MDSNVVEGISKYVTKGCSKNQKIAYCKKKDQQEPIDEARAKKALGL